MHGRKEQKGKGTEATPSTLPKQESQVRLLPLPKRAGAGIWQKPSIWEPKGGGGGYDRERKKKLNERS
jgi:hypothetical protein